MQPTGCSQLTEKGKSVAIQRHESTWVTRQARRATTHTNQPSPDDETATRRLGNLPPVSDANRRRRRVHPGGTGPQMAQPQMKPAQWASRLSQPPGTAVSEKHVRQFLTVSKFLAPRRPPAPRSLGTALPATLKAHHPQSSPPSRSDPPPIRWRVHPTPPPNPTRHPRRSPHRPWPCRTAFG
jgi:hypothetical protein